MYQSVQNKILRTFKNQCWCPWPFWKTAFLENSKISIIFFICKSNLVIYTIRIDLADLILALFIKKNLNTQKFCLLLCTLHKLFCV